MADQKEFTDIEQVRLQLYESFGNAVNMTDYSYGPSIRVGALSAMGDIASAIARVETELRERQPKP